jgi:hypothetical protein
LLPRKYLISNCLAVITVRVAIRAVVKRTADQSMVRVRYGDETFVLCARYVRVFAEYGGVVFSAPDARLVADVLCVVISLST